MAREHQSRRHGVLLGVRATAQLTQNRASLGRDVPAGLWAEIEALP